jgi:hypothetical protein
LQNRTSRTLLAVLPLAAGLVLASPPEAHATHFRYGLLQWQPTGVVTGEVKFTVRMALRRNTLEYGSFPAGIDIFAETGDIITEGQGDTKLAFGDNTITPTLRFIVTDFSVAENWLFVEALEPGTNSPGIPHVYAGNGPYTAQLALSVFQPGCCRLSSSSLANRPDGTYPVQTTVFPRSGNSSPSSSLVPIVIVPRSATGTFLVPAADPDGDRVRWRMSTDAEAGGPSHPPGIGINPATGQVTWNNLGLTDTRFWTTQVVIEDLDAAGAVKTKTPVDFLLKIVPLTGNPPTCSVSPAGLVTVPAGTPVTFTVTGTDTPGEQLILNSGGVPVGATMTPPLPLSQPTPVSSTFNWTPAASQAGTHVISYAVIDPAGQQALCSKTIRVVTNTPPTVTCPAPVKAQCSGPGGSSQTLTAHVFDADGDSLTVSWSVNGTVVATQTVPSGGTTTSADVSLTHTFPLGTNSVEVTVSDGQAAAVSCQTSVTVVDTTAPVVACGTEASLLWPPNHNMINVGLAASASDACHPGGAVGVAAFGDEDDEDPTGDGRFSPDALHIAPVTLELRAEREGDQDGRVYLLVASSTDGSGNRGWACCTVVVPLNMSPASRARVAAQAAAAQAVCQATGAAPTGYFILGDGGVLGPKQEPRASSRRPRPASRSVTRRR